MKYNPFVYKVPNIFYKGTRTDWLITRLSVEENMRPFK